ncbi:UNVERIFIED_CONTAM: hypothetical protein K2H54_040443 [Gekko kuhli]
MIQCAVIGAYEQLKSMCWIAVDCYRAALVEEQQTLATELQRIVKEIRTRIKHTKKIQQEKKYGSGISEESIHRAQYLAASILNISKTDLDDILEVEDEEEMEQIKRELENDKEWMSYLQKLLEGQVFNSFTANLVADIACLMGKRISSHLIV